MKTMTIDDLMIVYCDSSYWSGVRGKLTPAMLKLMLGRLGMELLSYNLIVTTTLNGSHHHHRP